MTLVLHYRLVSSGDPYLLFSLLRVNRPVYYDLLSNVANGW